MVKTFTEAGWNVIVNQPNNQGKGILIPFEEHGIQDPIVQVFKSYEGGLFKLVDIDISHSEANEILLNCNNPFNGKVVIK